MSRDQNIRVFEDSMVLCNWNDHLAQSIRNSIKGQRIITEDDYVSGPSFRSEKQCVVKITIRRSLEAAAFYDGRTAVLNFASWRNPGGGVANGANAQEESLCRISTLYPCLSDRIAMQRFYYPHRISGGQLHNDDCIYTPDVIVFKSDSDYPRLLPEECWYKVDVITCAAPNLRNRQDGRIWISERDLMTIHENRLTRILDVAAENGVENVVLGAFGCGAFANNPTVVSKASFRVIQNYLHTFKFIEFAIYSNHGDDSNYRAFVDTKERIF